MATEENWGTHTSIPWREWIIFQSGTRLRTATMHTDGVLTWDAANQKSYWEDLHRPYAFLGKDRVSGAYDGYQAIWKPIADDFCLDDQLNTIHTVGCRMIIGEKERIIDTESTIFKCHMTFLTEDNEVDWNKVTGQYYDGVNEWSNYPPDIWDEEVNVSKPGLDTGGTGVVMADLPHEYQSYMYAKTQSGYITFNEFNSPYDENAAHFFRNGFKLETGNFYYGPGDWTYKVSNRDYFTVRPVATRVLYLNGCVNSLSRYSMPAAGGVRLALNGLGFSIPNADLQDYCYGASNFDHEVENIHFLGREGQGDYVLNWNSGNPSRDFDQTNTKITIPSMPAMEPGTYYIRLEQRDLERGSYSYYSYAGDWRTRESGRAYPGQRHVFVVGPTTDDPEGPFFKWGWRYDDIIYEYYAPIDTRSTEIFWEGRVLGLSSVTRGIDDKTGLFKISDATVDLANNDMHFSRLLSRYHCKDQGVAITYGWGNQPAAWHEAVFLGVCDDYSQPGNRFSAILKDLGQMYIKGQVPRRIITSEDFPDAPEGSLGQAIPDLLGEHTLTTTSTPGAIEAILVDESSNRYLMAGGPLHSVPQVYSDGTSVASANYTIWVDTDGLQYIDFNSSQGDNKITFNCTGYQFSLWDSDNGYIQNPAYIIAFYLAILLQVPVNFIDLDSLDELAQIYEDAGWHESGKLAITALEGADAILQSLLYSFGVKYWQTRDGQLRFGRKDISNLDTDLYFHAQIDMKSSPTREFNLREAVNSINVLWDYIPASDVHKGARQGSDQPSINQFQNEIVASEPWKFPWITSGSFVLQRAQEDLLKLAYGDKKIKFEIPLTRIADIDIFDNFKIQDPFGLSWTKSGESTRYYYVTELSYNWSQRTIGVTAVDLQWLLQQYFIFGDEDEMPEDWANTTDYYRLYAYMCDEDTDTFADGTRGKELIDENIIGEN